MTDDLIEAARRIRMTEAEQAKQRESFAYGNANLANPAVTKELVKNVASIFSSQEKIETALGTFLLMRDGQWNIAYACQGDPLFGLQFIDGAWRISDRCYSFKHVSLHQCIYWMKLISSAEIETDLGVFIRQGAYRWMGPDGYKLSFSRDDGEYYWVLKYQDDSNLISNENLLECIATEVRLKRKVSLAKVPWIQTSLGVFIKMANDPNRWVLGDYELCLRRIKWFLSRRGQAAWGSGESPEECITALAKKGGHNYQQFEINTSIGIFRADPAKVGYWHNGRYSIKFQTNHLRRPWSLLIEGKQKTAADTPQECVSNIRDIPEALDIIDTEIGVFERVNDNERFPVEGTKHRWSSPSDYTFTLEDGKWHLNLASGNYPALIASGDTYQDCIAAMLAQQNAPEPTPPPTGPFTVEERKAFSKDEHDVWLRNVILTMSTDEADHAVRECRALVYSPK